MSDLVASRSLSSLMRKEEILWSSKIKADSLESRETLSVKWRVRFFWAMKNKTRKEKWKKFLFLRFLFQSFSSCLHYNSFFFFVNICTIFLQFHENPCMTKFERNVIRNNHVTVSKTHASKNLARFLKLATLVLGTAFEIHATIICLLRYITASDTNIEHLLSVPRLHQD